MSKTNFSQSEWLEARSDLESAHLWAIKAGVMKKVYSKQFRGYFHQFSISAKDALSLWPKLGWRGKAYFEAVAEDENFHSLIKYLQNNDLKGVKRYLD